MTEIIKEWERDMYNTHLAIVNLFKSGMYRDGWLAYEEAYFYVFNDEIAKLELYRDLLSLSFTFPRLRRGYKPNFSEGVVRGFREARPSLEKFGASDVQLALYLHNLFHAIGAQKARESYDSWEIGELLSDVQFHKIIAGSWP